MSMETCRICGGDGRIGNAFGGSSTTCPGCHGTGRRADTESLLRDVTKTKASHHRPQQTKAAVEKPQWPQTFDGGELAKEVQASSLSADAKQRLVREIIEYEGSHGKCTQTFTKKIRKQVRPKG
jgi:DnaJ-class molecular chaperone